VLRQARYFDDPGRQSRTVELVDDGTEVFFTGHLRLRLADQKA